MKKYFRVFIPKVQYACPRVIGSLGNSVFPSENQVDKWNLLKFQIPVNGGIVSDYLSSDIGGRLCSNKLMKVIEDNKAEEDSIQWLPVAIEHKDSGEILLYHHLHFTKPFSGYSLEHSKFDHRGKMIGPVWLYEDICSKEIFTCAGLYQKSMIIISGQLLNKIECTGCTGLTLKPAPIIYNDEGVKAS